MANNNRQICKIVKSDPSSRKIIVEINGKILNTEKIIGLDFRPGDFACYQTFDGSGKSLVVALSPDEIKKVAKIKEQTEPKKEPEKEISELSFLEPESGMVPLDEEIFHEQVEEDRKKSYYDPEQINNPRIINKLKLLFEDYISEKEEEESIREIFPVIAVQKDEKYEQLKESVFKRADQVILRSLVNNQSNREVIIYFNDLVRNIRAEEDHERFFSSLEYYLKRLRKLQAMKRWSSEKMGVLIHPIYTAYIKKFNRQRIEEWITSNSTKAI